MQGVILTVLVALLHLYIMILESFQWEAARTRKIFGVTQEAARSSKALAQNMGLYNAFLGVGLIVGLVTNNTSMTIYLLCCIIIAGVVGAVTANRRIIYIQSVPALLALIAISVRI